MTYRSDFDSKIVRDLLIPGIFFSLATSDRYARLTGWLTLLILLALGLALFELLAMDTYLHYRCK
jgi:hypothetical protein